MIEEVGLSNGCDLDLLLFFARHPHVVLSSEQLASYVGYDLQQVARSLDLLVGTGILRRSLKQSTSGRMYVLDVARSEPWLEPLRQACATPDGRNALRAMLRRRRSTRERRYELRVDARRTPLVNGTGGADHA